MVIHPRGATRRWNFTMGRQIAAALLFIAAGAACSGGGDDGSLRVPTYDARTLPFVAEAEPFQAAVSDLNADGIPDIVVCGTTFERGFVRIYLGKPGGDYDIRDLDVPLSPRAVILPDLDGDERPDLVTANNRARSITVFRGDGAGGFNDRRDIAFSLSPFAVLAEDLDRDGLPDLAVAAEGGLVGIFFNRGGFAFDKPLLFKLPYGPADVAAVDIDGDGRRDLAVPIWRENSIAIFWNHGGRRLEAGPTVVLDGKMPFAVVGADFDRDGHPDLAVPLLDRGSVQVLLGKGDGAFIGGPELAAGRGTRNVVLARLNGDDYVDLVATSTESGGIKPFYGTAGGRFATVAPLTAGKHPRAATASDLNGDRLDDLVVANLHSYDVTLLLSRPEETVLAEVPQPGPGGRLEALADLAGVFDAAVSDMRAGDAEGALAAFARISDAGGALLREGALVPDVGSPEWIRYLASVLLASDIRRYRLGDPAGAREIERGLAVEAERQGYLNVACLEWMAVADIERYDLGDLSAAAETYERIARLSQEPDRAAPAAEAYPSITDAALYAIDSMHAGEKDYAKRLQMIAMPYHVKLGGSDIARMMLPHYPAYQTGTNPIESYRAFAEAHPKSFRAAYADYFAFIVTMTVGPHLGDAAALHDAFLERYPRDLLDLSVTSTMLLYYKRVRKEKEYGRQLAIVRRLGERFGFGADVVALDQKGKAPPTAP